MRYFCRQKLGAFRSLQSSCYPVQSMSLVSCVFMWQTCYNRCVSSSQLVTTLIPSSEFHTHSMSTVTSTVTSAVSTSTNSSILRFAQDTNATTAGVSTVTTSITSTADVLSEASVLPNRKTCREPLSYVSAFTLSILWHVVYWTSQALTWFAALYCLLWYLVSSLT